MVLIQRNHLIEQLAAAASHPALGYAILPRTLNRSRYSRDLHRANCCSDFQSILWVVILDEELGHGLVGKGFA